MKKRPLALLVSTLVLAAAPAAAGPWNAFTPLPQPRFGAAAAELGGKLYVLGGTSTAGTELATFWDPAASAWAEANPLSWGRYFLGAAAADGQLFALGGIDADGAPSAASERFDPASGTWSDATPMPAGRALMGVAAAGGVLFVAGGQDVLGDPLAECSRYDPAANAWSPIAPLPTPRTGVAAAALGGRVWVIGGQNLFPVPTVEVYDPGSNAWSAGPDLPEPLFLATAASFAGRVWVIGGFDASFRKSPRVYSADASGAWRAEASLPEPLAASSAAAVGLQLFVTGGFDSTGARSASVYVQTDSPPPPADSLRVEVTLAPPVLNAASQGRWIKATLEATSGSVADLDLASVRLGGVAADLSGPVTVQDGDGDGHVELELKFPRSAFTALGDGEHVLVLQGRTRAGTPVTGSALLGVYGTATRAQKPKIARRALTPFGSAGGRTGIAFSLDVGGEVALDILDLQGRVVERIEQGFLPAGNYERDWPGAGRAAPTGIYFVRLRSADVEEMARLVVVH